MNKTHTHILLKERLYDFYAKVRDFTSGTPYHKYVQVSCSNHLNKTLVHRSLLNEQYVMQGSTILLLCSNYVFFLSFLNQSLNLTYRAVLCGSVIIFVGKVSKGHRPAVLRRKFQNSYRVMQKQLHESRSYVTRYSRHTITCSTTLSPQLLMLDG